MKLFIWWWLVIIGAVLGEILWSWTAALIWWAGAVSLALIHAGTLLRKGRAREVKRAARHAEPSSWLPDARRR